VFDAEKVTIQEFTQEEKFQKEYYPKNPKPRNLTQRATPSPEPETPWLPVTPAPLIDTNIPFNVVAFVHAVYGTFRGRHVGST